MPCESGGSCCFVPIAYILGFMETANVFILLCICSLCFCMENGVNSKWFYHHSLEVLSPRLIMGPCPDLASPLCMEDHQSIPQVPASWSTQPHLLSLRVETIGMFWQDGSIFLNNKVYLNIKDHCKTFSNEQSWEEIKESCSGRKLDYRFKIPSISSVKTQQFGKNSPSSPSFFQLILSYQGWQ